jgi:hypothetical protein
MATNLPMTRSRLTEVNDGYETCERTCAVLRIYPGELNPSEVTKELGIQPTSSVLAGQRGKENSLGLARVGRINAWLLSSEPVVHSRDLRHHLDWLLDLLETGGDALRRLQAQPDVRMSVNCVWWSRYGDGGPTLWPEQMLRLAQLNLECSFEFSDYSDSESS